MLSPVCTPTGSIFSILQTVMQLPALSRTKTIRKAEDRLEFKETMEKIGEPCAASLVVENIEDGVAFAKKIGYPVVLRPAYTLGGSGGGIAHHQGELEEILQNGLRLSRVGQVLVERCIAGWKEIEYEVMRDSVGNCITVCNMKNITVHRFFPSFL